MNNLGLTEKVVSNSGVGMESQNPQNVPKRDSPLQTDVEPKMKKQKSGSSFESPFLSGSSYWRIPLSELVQGEVIGQGGFGVVKKGKWRGLPVAIKVLHKTNNKKMIEMFQKEAEFLIRLR